MHFLSRETVEKAKRKKINLFKKINSTLNKQKWNVTYFWGYLSA